MTQSQMNVRQEALDALYTIEKAPKDNARRTARHQLRLLVDRGPDAWGEDHSENRELLSFCTRIVALPDAAVSPVIEDVLHQYRIVA